MLAPGELSPVGGECVARALAQLARTCPAHTHARAGSAACGGGQKGEEEKKKGKPSGARGHVNPSPSPWPTTHTLPLLQPVFMPCVWHRGGGGYGDNRGGQKLPGNQTEPN